MSDLVEVWLEDDYYTNEGWIDPEGLHPDQAKYHIVCQVPREQRDRWREISKAYDQMQEEIHVLMYGRSRG